MSKRFRAWRIEDPLLLPVSVRDFVDEKHLATFVLSVVRDELHLDKILSSTPARRVNRLFSRPATQGRPALQGSSGDRRPPLAVNGINLEAAEGTRSPGIVHSAAVMRQPRWAAWPIEG